MKCCEYCELSHYITKDNETKLYCRFKKQIVESKDSCYGFQKDINKENAE